MHVRQSTSVLLLFSSDVQALAPRSASARDIAEAHTSICADGRGEEEGLHTSSLFVHIGYLQGPCMSLRPKGVNACRRMVGGQPAASLSTTLAAEEHAS